MTISLRLAFVHNICYCELLEVSPEDHALHQANISHAHTEPSVQIRHQKRTTRQIKLPAANSTGNSNHIASEKRLTKININVNKIQISEIRHVAYSMQILDNISATPHSRIIKCSLSVLYKHQ